MATPAQIALLTPSPMMEHPEDMMETRVEMPDEDADLRVDLETGEVSEVSDIEEQAKEAVLSMIPFSANLAEYLSEEELDDIGTKLVEWVKTDLKSRQEWYETAKVGMERLGIYNPKAITDTGISEVNHPLLIEAAVQFQARAMAELFPPGGPVKCALAGDETPDYAEQARRVEKYMNYQLTVEDRDYYDERDQMMFMLPFTGSEFDKQYPDAVSRKVVSRAVRCDDFVVPYDSRGLRTASRYTHIIHMLHNDYRKQVAVGFYLDADLGEPPMTEELKSPMGETFATLDGQTRPEQPEEDREHTFYEVHIDYDLPGFERDFALPYVITTDANTGKVLSIYRNWKENDDTYQKRIWFTHKKISPWFRFLRVRLAASYWIAFRCCHGHTTDTY